MLHIVILWLVNFLKRGGIKMNKEKEIKEINRRLNLVYWWIAILGLSLIGVILWLIIKNGRI